MNEVLDNLVSNAVKVEKPKPPKPPTPRIDSSTRETWFDPGLINGRYDESDVHMDPPSFKSKVAIYDEPSMGYQKRISASMSIDPSITQPLHHSYPEIMASIAEQLTRQIMSQLEKEVYNGLR